jgi:hypothetical protein
MKCSKCGVEVLAEAQFCQKCGARLEAADALETTATAATEQVETTRTADRLKPRAASGAAASADEPLWNGTYSPKAMIGVWIGLALLTVILLIVAISVGGSWWTVFFIATPVLWLGGVAMLFYNQWSVRYTMTTKRFTHEHGLLRRVTHRIEVIDMDDVSVTQNLVERFTGTGTIRITSSDRSHPEFCLRGIDNAVAIATQLDDARRAERERRGLYVESI